MPLHWADPKAAAGLAGNFLVITVMAVRRMSSVGFQRSLGSLIEVRNWIGAPVSAVGNPTPRHG
jgi:hypothetical protein